MGRTQAYGCVRWILPAVCSMALMFGLGCEASQSQQLPRANRNPELPGHVRLPAGFYPLTDHYDLDNESDHYNGWPRYIVSRRDKAIMAYVPAQTILMGGGPSPNAVPAREVVVDHFYMDIHEVTNAQFHRFGRVRGDITAYEQYWSPDVNDDHPVRNVSWHEASRFSTWAGKELPTEAQWEAAARGDDGRIYPWGNNSHSDVTRFLANTHTGRMNFDGYEYTAPVMSFAAGVSPFGHFQMAGNVAEWCADWYDPSRYAYPSPADPATALYRGALPFGDENYPNHRGKHIRASRVGPPLGDQRVIRGGSFADPIEQCRVDVRRSARPGARQFNVGFRSALVLPPSGQ
jgi:formylglycine-generating enzyme required for sulfatase activity